MKNICRDLKEECDTLDAIVADLGEKEWSTITPFAGWSIKDEISHLAIFDKAARLSATDQEAFARFFEELSEGVTSPSEYQKKALTFGQSMTVDKLMEWWRDERASLIRALEPLEPKTRLPWFGPSMSARSFATARLMETWAHGQDVVDTVSAHRPPADRLKHVAHLGVVTFGWSFTTNNMEVPETPVRIELTAPSGSLWTWGPEDAEDIVRGSAEDFCLVVARRRHVDDTDIVTKGETAGKWISIAQAFAGPPEPCPEPGSFPKKG